MAAKREAPKGTGTRVAVWVAGRKGVTEDMAAELEVATAAAEPAVR